VTHRLVEETSDKIVSDNTNMEYLIAILLVLVTACLLLYRKVFNYWKDLGVLQFPIDFPEGNAKGVMKTIHLKDFTKQFYEKMKAKGAKFCGVYMYSRPVMIVSDLDLVKQILIKDFNVFPNRGIYHNEKDDPVSAHLFNLEDDPWRQLRQKLTPTFTSGKLKMMFGTICEVSDRLLTAIDKQIDATGQLEVKDTLARFTTDVIGSVGFGIECNSLEDKDSKFYEMGTKIFAPVKSSFAKRMLRSTFRDLSRKLGIKGLPEELSSFYLGITKETVEYREKNPEVKRQDFMNLLVQMKQADVVTVEQIAAQ
jgi:cytochrome P450 family 6